MSGFIVERYWPGVTEADLRLAAAGLRAADRAGVRYLGSILMPGDEVALFRFDAVSAGQVVASGEQAGLRCDRAAWSAPGFNLTHRAGLSSRPRATARVRAVSTSRVSITASSGRGTARSTHGPQIPPQALSRRPGRRSSLLP